MPGHPRIPARPRKQALGSIATTRSVSIWSECRNSVMTQTISLCHYRRQERPNGVPTQTLVLDQIFFPRHTIEVSRSFVTFVLVWLVFPRAVFPLPPLQ